MSLTLNGLGKAFRKPQFVLCVLILGSAAVGLRAAVNHFEVVFRKLPVPLQTPLHAFNRGALKPEYTVEHSATLAPELVQELGTDEYISWYLRDTRKPNNNPLSQAALFVTYYTGDPDQVPHVPDVCYLGGGFQNAGTTTTTLDIPELGEIGQSIPIRCLTFKKQTFGQARYATVLYVFSVNGRFESTRNGVRVALGNLSDKYAYFSKVEVSLSVSDQKAGIEAGLAILRKALPELVKSHWPDWQTVNATTDTTIETD